MILWRFIIVLIDYPWCVVLCHDHPELYPRSFSSGLFLIFAARLAASALRGLPGTHSAYSASKLAVTTPGPAWLNGHGRIVHRACSANVWLLKQPSTFNMAALSLQSHATCTRKTSPTLSTPVWLRPASNGGSCPRWRSQRGRASPSASRSVSCSPKT